MMTSQQHSVTPMNLWRCFWFVGLTLSLLIGNISFASRENKCTEVFAVAQASIASARTHESARTLLRMSEQKINESIKSLASLRLNIDLAKSAGADSILLTALKSDFKNKEQALIKYLEQNQVLTRAEFNTKIKDEIRLLQRENRDEAKQVARSHDEQERKVSDAVVDGSKIVMRRIEPGTFKMGKGGKRIKVTFADPFELMATPVTQVIWAEVAALANVHLGTGLSYSPSAFIGSTNPVERISYDDAQAWISALNQLSEAGVPELKQLIQGYKQGDVYRLPTEAEWEFVITGRGTIKSKYHFGNDPSQLGNYAWYGDNSQNRTQPVAQKRPLLVEGNEFFDMHGNVWEWVQDWDATNVATAEGDLGRPTVSTRTLRGGAWSNKAEGLSSQARNNHEPNHSLSLFGFRLVRVAR